MTGRAACLRACLPAWPARLTDMPCSYLNGSIPTFNNCPGNVCQCSQTGRVELQNVTNHPVDLYHLLKVDMFGVRPF
jgi:hypothetical protein